MAVNVVYFAAARELAGCDRESLPMRYPSVDQAEFRVLLAREKPRLGPYLERMRLACNGDFMTADQRIDDGDEVTVMPPVAGGSPARLAEVRETPLSVDEALAAVRHPGAGGICVFLGVVRDNADGKSVARLDYEAYAELANKETARILLAIEQEIEGTRVAAVHRVGELRVGDLAVVVAASAPHRDEAFRACRAAIDRIKETVPVWKKEWGLSGEGTWVNLESSD